MNLFTYDWKYYEEEDVIYIFCLKETGKEEKTEKTHNKKSHKNKKTHKSNTVIVKITDFIPFIYIDAGIIPLDEFKKIELSPKLDNVFFHKMEQVYFSKLYRESKNSHNQRYIRVYCKNLINSNLSAIRDICQNYYKQKGLFVYDTLGSCYDVGTDNIIQFFSFTNISSCNWIHLSNYTLVNKENQVYESTCSNISLLKDSTSNTIPVPVVLSFDIEVYSSAINIMPNPQNEKDVIFQISMVFSGLHSSLFPTILLTLGNIDDLNIQEAKETNDEDIEIINRRHNTKVYSFSTEEELLIKFVNIIQEYNPNVIIGYNILAFDFNYIIGRMSFLNITEHLKDVSLISGKQSGIKKKHFKEQVYNYIEMEGRVIIDMILIVKRDVKLDNYKLDTAARHFINSQKDPLTHLDIFDAFKFGVLNPSKSGIKKLQECGRYCVQDSVLVLRMYEKMLTWYGTLEMSNICLTPASLLYINGQQLKIFNQTYKYCYDNNIIVERNRIICHFCGVIQASEYKIKQHIKEIHNDKKYEFQGATVLEPTPGLYNYVVPFDFSSLYPSLFIAYNIDYSTFTLDESIPDEKCNIVEWQNENNEEENENAENSKFRFRFLKEPKGVIPTIIQNLLDIRKETKRQMKSLPKNSEEYNILDMRQLSYKISANSMYGAMGVERGYLPFQVGANAITALGRLNLKNAISHLKTKYDATIVYGDTDSCYVQFPNVPLNDLWKHSKNISNEIFNENIFPKPMLLDFEEKIYNPFFILAKKRYMWRTFNIDGTTSQKIGTKGVLLSRRDNCLFLRDIYRNIVEQIFQKTDCDKILYHIISLICSILQRNISVNDLIITKRVGDINNYKSKTLPAHVQLSERLKKRGIRIDIGQRLEFLILHSNKLTANNVEKIEHPEYFIEYREYLRIDYLYYIHLIAKQLDDIIFTAFNVKDYTMKIYKMCKQRQKLHEQLFKLRTDKMMM